MKKCLPLLILLSVLMNQAYAQTSFKNATWSYHIKQELGGNVRYLYQNLYKANRDTSIGTETFSVMESHLGEVIDYLQFKQDTLHYYFEGEVLRLFVFNQQIGDSFEVDLRLTKDNKDTVIKNVGVKIDTIRYEYATNGKDSSKVYMYSILSASLKDVYPSLPIPYKVTHGISRELLLTHMANYNTIRFSTLFNPFVNTGFETKPFLSCYENPLGNFSYKIQEFIDKSLPCDYYSGLFTFDKNKTNLTVYPNPVRDVLYLKSTVNEASDLSIYNVNGQLLKTFNLNDWMHQQHIDVSFLPKGVYFIKLTTKTDDIFTTRFVKE